MNPIIQIIITILGSGALFSFLQFLIQRNDDKAEKTNQLYTKIEEELNKQEKVSAERFESLHTELHTGLEEREETSKARYMEHQEAIEKLNEAILQLTENDTKQSQYMQYIGLELMGIAHQQLVSLTDHYQLRGAITLKEKASLDAIYKPYHDGLGGNGDGQAGYEYAMSLPVVTDQKAYEMDVELERKKFYEKEK